MRYAVTPYTLERRTLRTACLLAAGSVALLLCWWLA